MVNVDNLIEPEGWYGYKVSESNIHGKGIFSTVDYDKNELIGLFRTAEKRTILGRYTNHSATPNAQVIVAEGGYLYLVAIKPIKGCMGGQNGDEITIDYEHTFNLSTGVIK